MTKFNIKNERIKRRYLDYLRHADGKAETTIRQVEAVIFGYEKFTKFADFGAFDQQKAISFKEHLAEQKKAKATILSNIRMFKKFFSWLACQPGYKSKLVLTDIDYLSLSEKDVREANAPAERDCPSIEQIKQVLLMMPKSTPLEKRNRALIAFTILTGIRDGALITLRLKHVDLERKIVTQVPNEVSTKFSKRIDSFFFPVGEEVEVVAVDWVHYLREELGFSGDDPLFPKTAMGQDKNDCFMPNGLLLEFWANAGPVRKIFKDAFTAAGYPSYTPHRFRNTLVQLGYRYCKTPESLKAWSQNLGHESPLTTLMSYGKINLIRQGELIRGAIQEESDRELLKRFARIVENRGEL
ncbi:MAG: site-specific integrase [bacterium]|nr:site-specific integrase [bacterium]